MAHNLLKYGNMGKAQECFMENKKFKDHIRKIKNVQSPVFCREFPLFKFLKSMKKIRLC